MDRASLNELNRVFSILHDGTITAWTPRLNSLWITIDCQYLAFEINPAFTEFKVQLLGLQGIYFEENNRNTYPLPESISLDLFLAEVQIIGAWNDGNSLHINSHLYLSENDQFFGHIKIDCNTFLLFDQASNRLTVDELQSIASNYWQDLEDHSEIPK